MSWWQVERVARLEDLLAVAHLEPELALEHIAPVRAGTAVVGQALEQGRLVDVLTERHEVHGVPVDVLPPVHHRTVVAALGGALLGYLRHLWAVLSGWCPGEPDLHIRRRRHLAAVDDDSLKRVVATRSQAPMTSAHYQGDGIRRRPRAPARAGAPATGRPVLAVPPRRVRALRRVR